jgi:[acyl-carrier-protein] S-malonyltransferase
VLPGISVRASRPADDAWEQAHGPHRVGVVSGPAFLFPGQGSQKVGMGAGLKGRDAARLAHHLALGGEAAGVDLPGLCREGPSEALTRTEAAQPALFALSITLAEIARELGIRPAAVAGHSLGEYSAAATADALGVEEGMRLVAERGRLMARIQAERPGAMAAVLGLDVDAVEALCARAAGSLTLCPANLNSPDQVVVSGDLEAVERLLEEIAESGRPRFRAVRLPVGAAFHTSVMRPVQERLADTMAALSWRDPEVPLVANATGRTVTTADCVRDALTAQITAPVRWVACVRALVESGCSTFLELGPGRVLAGLVRRIAPSAEVVAADTRAKLEAFAARC